MLEAELERSRWRGRECSLLVTRVDKLPSYAAREQVKLLERLVEAVRQESHPGDAAGRTDGPEISVIVAEASTNEAEIIGQRIVAKFEPNAVLAGVACFPGHATSPEDLLSRARAALHTSERPTMSRFSHPGGSIATAPLDPGTEV